jgi:hypothetical protein
VKQFWKSVGRGYLQGFTNAVISEGKGNDRGCDFTSLWPREAGRIKKLNFFEIKGLTFKISMVYDGHHFKWPDTILSQDNLLLKKEVI